MKTCIVCNEEKDVEDFYRVKDSFDNSFQSVCMACRIQGYTSPKHTSLNPEED